MNSWTVFQAVAVASILVSSSATVVPANVDVEIEAGGSSSVEKTLTADGITGRIDVCWVQDSSGSFSNDCPPLVSELPGIVSLFPSDTTFGFNIYGSPGDYQNLLTQGSSAQFQSAVEDFCNPFSSLGASEETYDAIFRAATNTSVGCNFRPGAAKILIAVTDEPCVEFEKTEAQVMNLIAREGITFIGLSGASGSDECLGALGTTERIEDSENIAAAIDDATGQSLFAVEPTFSGEGCNDLDFKFDTSFPVQLRVGDEITFEETVTPLVSGPALLVCEVCFNPFGCQTFQVEVSGDGPVVTLVPTPTPTPLVTEDPMEPSFSPSASPDLFDF